VIHPYQVCIVAIRVGEVEYPRPCVAITVLSADGIAGALAISSKLDLYKPDQHFLINANHPDFPATGLSTTSYVIGSPVIDITPEEVEKVIGALTGELGCAFRRWIE